MKISILVILIVAVCDSTARQMSLANKVCLAESFDLSIITTNADSGDDGVVITMIARSKLNQALPVGFANDTDYTDTCLNYFTYKLVKYGAESNVIQEIQRKPSDNKVEQKFDSKNIEYYNQYDIKVSYTQKAPAQKTYYLEDISIDTCFGQPDIVRNLNATVQSVNDNKIIISWDKPAKERAPSVCYYEIVIQNQETKIKDTYTTQSLSWKYNGDASKAYRITVEAFNENMYQGSKCYPSSPDINGCSRRGSGLALVDFQGVTTLMPTTTKTNGTSSIYNFTFSSLVLAITSLLYVLNNF